MERQDCFFDKWKCSRKKLDLKFYIKTVAIFRTSKRNLRGSLFMRDVSNASCSYLRFTVSKGSEWYRSGIGVVTAFLPLADILIIFFIFDVRFWESVRII